MFHFSSHLRRTALALPLLTTLAPSQITFAQPPDAPSTIKAPANNPVRAFVPPPDPPLITPAQLQTLTGGPTLVSLSGRDLDLADVTKALLEAGGFAESPYRIQNEKQNVSVDWNQTPFWSAAADVERQTKMKWDGRFGEGVFLGRFSQGAGVGLDGQVGAQTPFVTLVANSISRTMTRTVSLGEKAAPPVNSDRVQIQMGAYFDPKLSVQSNTLRDLKFFKKGAQTPLIGRGNEMGAFYSGRASSISQLSVALPPEATPGTIFSIVSGVLHSVVVAATEPFRVLDLAATPKAEKTVGANQYALQSATFDNDQVTVRVSANIGEVAGQNRGYFFNNLFSTLRVRDAQGRELPRGGSSSSGGAKASGEFRFRLKNAQGEAIIGPYSLDWPIVTELKSLDVPFELRDVTVP